MSHYKSIGRLKKIMEELRSTDRLNGKEQPIETIRPLTVEETRELEEAILSGDWTNVPKDAGDIMLHLIFYSYNTSKESEISFEDVLNGICDKLATAHALQNNYA